MAGEACACRFAYLGCEAVCKNKASEASHFSKTCIFHPSRRKGGKAGGAAAKPAAKPAAKAAEGEGEAAKKAKRAKTQKTWRAARKAEAEAEAAKKAKRAKARKAARASASSSAASSAAEPGEEAAAFGAYLGRTAEISENTIRGYVRNLEKMLRRPADFGAESCLEAVH
jgi:hypothetical protein